MKIDPQTLSNRDAHHLFVGAVAPRPIAWVSTVDKLGRYNLAPYSTFTLMSAKPAVLGFGIGNTREGKKKDTLRNIEDTKEFAVSVVNEDLAEAMNLTSTDFPWGVSEFEKANLRPEKADLISAPLVAESPLKMECRLHKILKFGKLPDVRFFVIGDILRVHVDDGLYVDGMIDPYKLKAVGRLGGTDLYCRTRDVFELKRPDKV
ncbi:MAG: Flavin reductase like domain protein [Syntrophaceae bacterium PtaU1.Bin231]|nr:MAG: Flavin reductase like domain protein [Syntrophaceae bacterium PtaU1.Bin231]